jgi:carboxyl-terminal processing protease
MFRSLPLLLLMLPAQSTIAQENSSPTQIADAVVSAIELIDAKHINPPTRQEMLKRVVMLIRIGHETKNQEPVPQASSEVLPQRNSKWSRHAIGISSLVSKLSADEEFRAMLLAELTSPSNQESLASLGDDPLLPILSALGVQVRANKEAIVEKQIQANRYVGIGIAIGMKNDIAMMVKVMPGGAAQKGGAKAGDLIVSVDGKPTRGVSLRTVVDWLRGEKESSVDVQLQRGKELIEMTFVRDVVPMKTVHVSYNESGRATLATIQLDRIGASSVHEFRQIEREAQDRNVTGILLDLRRLNSVSAPLHETKLLADALISDKTIGYQLTRDSEHEFKAGPLAMFDGIPIVVLANSVVAGPGEWLVAALQQAGGAIVVGAATSGQGLATDHFPLPNADYTLTFPTSVLQTPDRQTLVASVPAVFAGIPQSTDHLERRAIAMRSTAGSVRSDRASRYVGRVVPDQWFDRKPNALPNDKWIEAGLGHLRKIVARSNAKAQAEGVSGE